jgi:CPA1 family monovalent cation:H+ antiporter
VNQDHLPLVGTLRAQYGHRLTHLEAHGGADHPPIGDPEHEQEMLEHRLIRRAVIDAERSAVHELSERGAIHDDVLRRIERDLDLEELRMEA